MRTPAFSLSQCCESTGLYGWNGSRLAWQFWILCCRKWTALRCAAKYGRSICFDGAYLQAAQAELWEAARGRIEVAETDCTEVGFVEKSKAAAWTECDKHEFVGEHIWKYIM